MFLSNVLLYIDFGLRSVLEGLRERVQWVKYMHETHG